MKDPGGHPGGEMHRARYVGRGVEITMPSLEFATLPSPPHVHQPGSLPNSILQGFLCTLPHAGMVSH